MNGSDEWDESTIEELLQTHIDLSEYESLVYLALIQHGKQSMKNISDNSGVPKQRVYDVVENLREMRFVELDDGYPKQAYAVEPTKVFGPIQEQIEQAQDRLEEYYDTISDIDSGVTQFGTRSTIDKYIEEMLLDAENTVFLMASLEKLTRYADVLQSLDTVQLRFIVSNLDEHDLSEDATALNTQTIELAQRARGTTRTEPFVLSVDRQKGLFWPNATVTQGDSERAYYISDGELAFLFDRFLSDSIWPLAQPIDHAEEPLLPSPPTEYYRIRDCLSDIERLSEEVPFDSLSLRFEGYDTVSGRQVAKEGMLSGFYFSQLDDRAYLELDELSEEYPNGRRITVGGWKSQQEDYMAYRIELLQRKDWGKESPDPETNRHLETCREELSIELSDAEVVVGFDGYIDYIRELVNERRSPRMYEKITDLDMLGEMFTRATKENTLHFEWVESDRGPGGHTAHVGKSFNKIGYDLMSIGYFGQPIRDEFNAAFGDADILSLGQPTSSQYLHFDDGKLLLTESGSHRALNWEMLCDYVPPEDMAEYLDGTDLVSIGGWALVPEISSIWEGFREQIYPMLSSPPDDVIVVTSDVYRLTETTLRRDLESLSALDDRIPITVVTTREQAEHLGDLYLSAEGSQSALPKLATELRDSIGVERFSITAIRESVLAGSDDPLRFKTPVLTDAAEEGTFEDHFAAGIGLGCVEDLSDESKLVLGSLFSSIYQQRQEPATIEELHEFLDTYDTMGTF